jgi:predicted lipid-binding transport protein (Tim44 family)/endogenous inhibitor of DNA gyrase (YacG/DUF329 family)
MGPCKVDGIVVGLLNISNVSVGDAQDHIQVTVEANYTKHVEGAPPARFVVHEEWTLSRDARGTSLEPAKMRVLSCAACGAPAEFTEAGACRYCGALVRRGVSQWLLTRRHVEFAESFDTSGLGETTEEVGTDDPTIVHPKLDEQKAQFASALGVEYGAFEAEFFDKTVTPVFLQMYSAWTRKAWGEVRHLLGDRLWESQKFWIEAYDAKGLTNKLEDVKIDRIEAVRIERDRYFESITVRVHAQCRDFTVDANGRTVGGRPNMHRRFTEYWTFVRSTAAKAPARGYEEKACPNCGAPVDRMGQAAVCGYCNAKVSTGDFGWVLTLITQDEVYRG